MDGIIFDVDGTLWDSTAPCAVAWTRAIQENLDSNAEISETLLKTVFGKTMTEIQNTLMPGYSPEEQLRAMEACYRYTEDEIREYALKPFDGVCETFRTLSKRIPLFIVSNCQCGYIELFLDMTGLGDTVTDHLCFGETSVSKDLTIRMLMERNGLKDTVYVGDTLGDFKACQEAGIPFIHARYGFGEVPQAEDGIEKITDLIERFS